MWVVRAIHQYKETLPKSNNMSKQFIRKNLVRSLIEEEAPNSDSSDGEFSDNSSDNEYNYNDDFMVRDSDVEEESKADAETSCEHSLLYEQARVEQALAEVKQLKRRVKGYRRRLKEANATKARAILRLKLMIEKKQKWRGRALDAATVVRMLESEQEAKAEN
jgi:hypothetical protein